jgi:hypothetical protein
VVLLLALIPAFSPEEKVKRSQRFGINPWLDWWTRIKQPDDSKGILLLLGGEGRDEGGQTNYLVLAFSI